MFLFNFCDLFFIILFDFIFFCGGLENFMELCGLYISGGFIIFWDLFFIMFFGGGWGKFCDVFLVVLFDLYVGGGLESFEDLFFMVLFNLYVSGGWELIFLMVMFDLIVCGGIWNFGDLVFMVLLFGLGINLCGLFLLKLFDLCGFEKLMELFGFVEGWYIYK